MGLFGKSWIQIVANPVGYIANRKSADKAAQEYAEKHPLSFGLDQTFDELSFLEAERRWVDACASTLKSEDVGKSKANCEKACQAVFDFVPGVASIRENIARQNEQEQAEVKAKLDSGMQTMFTVLGVFLFVGLIIYLLTSKNKQ
jgi:hypothetical protein